MEINVNKLRKDVHSFREWILLRTSFINVQIWYIGFFIFEKYPCNKSFVMVFMVPNVPSSHSAIFLLSVLCREPTPPLRRLDTFPWRCRASPAISLLCFSFSPFISLFLTTPERIRFARHEFAFQYLPHSSHQVGVPRID